MKEIYNLNHKECEEMLEAINKVLNIADRDTCLQLLDIRDLVRAQLRMRAKLERGMIK